MFNLDNVQDYGLVIFMGMGLFTLVAAILIGKWAIKRSEKKDKDRS